MTGEFTHGLHDVADDVARAHATGAGLPLERIDARARRLRRRHDATLVIASAAALAVVGLGGAALLERPGLPPAATPSDTATSPTPSGTPTASPTPTDPPTAAQSPTPAVPPPPDGPSAAPWGADDLETLLVDPAAVEAALPALAGLQPMDVPLGGWAMDPSFAVLPTEACRPAITVVLEEPMAFRRVGWSSETANLVQEVVVLADAPAAQAAFAALGTAHQACPEYGGSVPESSGAWYSVADVAGEEAGLPSYRIAGTESGEGHDNAWLLVDVLVDNVIVRTEAFSYAGGVEGTGTATDAAALGDGVERGIEAARAARQS